MDFSDIVVLFVIGFIFGLTSRLIYAKLSGNLRQPAKTLKPIRKVRYISPKLNNNPERADRGQEPPSDRKAANQ